MATQCNILSYSVKNDDDLKLLINQKIFPLSNGDMFQLQRRNYHSTNSLYYITTGGNSILLPSHERTVNENFFKGNDTFFNKLKKILNRNGKEICYKYFFRNRPLERSLNKLFTIPLSRKRSLHTRFGYEHSESK